MTLHPILAHIAGLPVEELVPLAYGATAAWVVVRMRASRFAARARGRDGKASDA
jgi:hypothetical protein